MNKAVPTLLSVAEAAQRLGVSKSWLNQSRLSGTGPTFTKIGARCLYDPDDLSAWLASRRRSSTSQASHAEAR